ncbi:MAG: glycogen synthase [Actinomycetota bacterium]
MAIHLVFATMRLAIVTREFPPEVYGGAGVHVTELVNSLKKHIDVEVICMGSQRETAKAFELKNEPGVNPALSVVQTDVEMATYIAANNFDLVHSHTWYANLAGHLASMTAGIPHIVTAHSLEPKRPWKAEQLGGGYKISSWIEAETYRAADRVIAVSAGMKKDVLDCYPFVSPEKVSVVHNGIDVETFKPTFDESVLQQYGIDPSRPIVLFVGRITRQKGLIHLLRAAKQLPIGVQLVLAASSPDEKVIGDEVAEAVAEFKTNRPNDIVHIDRQVSKSELVTLLSHASVFACPSIYEPLGIVNLEAMACETPVVASAVGGIPEVVVHGETGLLVEYSENDIAEFEEKFAAALNEVLIDANAKEMGKAGRVRAAKYFSWESIALQTIDLYKAAL